MKRLFLLMLALLPLSAAASPQLKIEYGPWVMAVGQDEATIVWTTPENSFDWVELVEDNGSTFYAENADRYYQTVSGRRFNGTEHSVRIQGLKPGHGYMYRVIGQTVIDDSDAYGTKYGPVSRSQVHRFRTLDESADSCRFAMVNDIHFDDARYTALCKDVNGKDFDFLLLNGDIVSYATSIDSVIKHTFSPIAGQAANMPVFFARGNHEGRGAQWYRLPEFFPTSTGEFYYSFRQGPVGFIVLDAGEDKPDSDLEYSNTAQYDEFRAAEAEWLKAAVKDPSFAKAPIKVVIIHIPSVTTDDSWYGENEAARLFNPILKKAGVDLMLSAHYHCYQLFKKDEWDNPCPIFVNSNMERLEFKADSKHLTIDTFNTAGEKVHHFGIDK